MILQYFKIKENDYKILADKIYLQILKQGKFIIQKNYVKDKNFEITFELISIFLVYYIKFYDFSDFKNKKKFKEELIKNFISDLDKSLRDIGIGDMSIGKYVKKYVKKFYYRIKTLDEILVNCDMKKMNSYLSSLKSFDENNLTTLSGDLIRKFEEIKKIK